MNGNLKGQRALVTGSTRGIGAAVAEALAAAGVDLVLSARSESDLLAQADKLSLDHQVRTAVAPADLADARAVEHLAATALDAFSGLDILINNAGISHPQMAVDVSAELWDDVMAVNVRAPALLGSRVGRAMAAA